MFNAFLSFFSISAFITWTYGLGITFFIRHVIHKGPYGKYPAFGLCLIFYLINSLLFTAIKQLSDPGQTGFHTHGTVWFIVAFVSYYIFIAESEKIKPYFNKWRNLMLAFLSVALIVLAVDKLSSSGFFGNLIKPRKPEVLKEYMGVPLGSNKDEIHYILGEPNYVGELVEHIPSDGKPHYITTSIQDLKAAGINFSGYDEWFYQQPAATEGVDIVFNKKSKKIDSVNCYAVDLHKVIPDTCEVYGVGLLKTEEDVVSALGKPNKEFHNDGKKSIFYYDLKVAYELFKKHVIRIQVSAPK